MNEERENDDYNIMTNEFWEMKIDDLPRIGGESLSSVQESREAN